MRTFLGARRALRFVPSGGPITTLPRVGPFASQPATPFAGLSDLDISAIDYIIGGTVSSPVTAKTVTIESGSGVIVDASQFAHFLWCNELILNSASITVSGFNGGDAPGGAVAGTGGIGASSGGTGAAMSDGIIPPEIDYGFSGGSGDASPWSSLFAWPHGTAGANAAHSDPGAGEGGPGGPGFGGGGGGGGCFTNPGTGNVGGGGGGGGGGLSSIVGNWLSVSGGSITADAGGGGGGSSDGQANGDNGGSGGQGVIYWAFRKKTGGAPSISAANGGNLYEINRAGTTLTARAWADTWNNLD